MSDYTFHLKLTSAHISASLRALEMYLSLNFGDMRELLGHPDIKLRMRSKESIALVRRSFAITREALPPISVTRKPPHLGGLSNKLHTHPANTGSPLRLDRTELGVMDTSCGLYVQIGMGNLEDLPYFFCSPSPSPASLAKARAALARAKSDLWPLGEVSNLLSREVDDSNRLAYGTQMAIREALLAVLNDEERGPAPNQATRISRRTWEDVPGEKASASPGTTQQEPRTAVALPQ